MKKTIGYFVVGALYTSLVFTIIIFLTVVLPRMTITSKPSEGLTVRSALQEIGRNVYKSEGCFYCHSQFVRLQDREMGELSEAGDYIYDKGNLLGTARTGPDLSNIGGQFPDGWHKAHHSDPRAMDPGSIMPSFEYLNRQKVPYTAEDGKEKEATRMEALIAYLQSLGRHKKYERYILPPYEFRFGNPDFESDNPVGGNAGSINTGRGIFQQNCAVCHSIDGDGDGPASLTMTKKPANFSRAFYKLYRDDMWFYRISEGVPGTRMPRWGLKLNKEQRWYLVNYLKTLPRTEQVQSKPETLQELKAKETLKTYEER